MDTTKVSVESRATLSGQKLNYTTAAGLREVTVRSEHKHLE